MAMPDAKPSPEILARLHALIASRRGGDPGASYTAKLFAEGRERIAKKLGEEAIETIIAALGGDKRAIAQESADLLYHLLVLWADARLAPDDVWAELERREGVSGIAEKSGRAKK